MGLPSAAVLELIVSDVFETGGRFTLAWLFSGLADVELIRVDGSMPPGSSFRRSGEADRCILGFTA